jgi:predicted acyltransferase
MSEHKRLISLDAFRGATIAAMILVNNPGSWSHIYPPLKHAQWHGWTFTDCIFPFFLFIVGVAMVFSFAKRSNENTNSYALYLHIIKRSAIILGLGLFLNGFPFWFDPNFSLATLRIPGVLQRIAICYLVVGFIVLNSKPMTQVYYATGFLLGYWLIVKLIPVPGFGAGVLDPKGNILWYLDSQLLQGHTWIYAPTPGFDPEGILSTIPAFSTVLFGALTGQWLRSERTPKEKTAWMFIAGSTMLLMGVILDMWLPINKNMWTSSYTIFMGGWALFCLSVFYWIIDVKGFSRWTTPLVIFGLNAIAIYVISELLAIVLGFIQWHADGDVIVTLHDYLYNWLLLFATPINASLLFAIAYVALMFGVVWLMWRKRVFIKF